MTHNRFSELFNEYLDGTASDVQQSEMFAMMGANDDYRREFTNEYLIRTAVSSSAKASGPTAVQTERLFLALGYGNQAPALLSGAVFSAGTSTTALFPMLMSALIGGTLVAILMLVPLNKYWSNNNPIAINKPVGSAKVASTLLQAPASEEVGSLKRSSSSTSKTSPRRALLSEGNPVSSDDSPTLALIEMPRTFAESVPPAVTTEHELATPKTLDLVATDISTDPLQSPLQQLNAPIGISIAVRSLHLASSPDIVVPIEGGSAFENLALAVSYQLTEDVGVGAEIGQERMLLQYVRRVQNVSEQVSLQPLQTFGGVFVRYQLNDVLSRSIAPYGVLQVGGTELGAMCRGSLGLAYKPSALFTCSIGLEASRLWYGVDGSNYTSTKLGWMYAIQLSL